MRAKNIVSLKKKQIIHEKGDYIVLSGYLICKIRNQLIYFAKVGDFISVDTDEIYYYEAKMDVELIHVGKDNARFLEEGREQLQKKIMACLAQRVIHFSEPVGKRLSSLLFQMGRELGHISTNNSCELPHLLTHQEIAHNVGCTREYLCSLRKKLIEEGKIADTRIWILLEWHEWEKGAMLEEKSID